jgi:molybdopterin-guanine dinucleotide biosynthesis protein A
MSGPGRPRFGLVLAGGESRRMGRDKAGIRIDGQTQLERTTELLAQHAEQVSVSRRRADDPAPGDCPVIADDPAARGPVAGIAAALRARPDADWLVAACDLPRLDHATLAALTDFAGRHPDAPAVAMRSEHDGLPEPLCAIWRAGMLPDIEAAVADARYCPRKMLIRAGVPLLDAVSPGALANMNTPDDLAQLTVGRSAS